MIRRPPRSTLFPTRRSSDLRRNCVGEGRTAASGGDGSGARRDRKSTRLNSSHLGISYAVFCLKKKNSRERRGIKNIIHELNPLFTINVTMRDIKSENVYSRF